MTVHLVVVSWNFLAIVVVRYGSSGDFVGGRKHTGVLQRCSRVCAQGQQKLHGLKLSLDDAAFRDSPFSACGNARDIQMMSWLTRRSVLAGGQSLLVKLHISHIAAHLCSAFMPYMSIESLPLAKLNWP
jgi:hypothetical protein